MSGGSRDARAVLDEIRHVINHLENKDRKLQSELNMLKRLSTGDESDPLVKTRGELMNLNSKNSDLQTELQREKSKFAALEAEKNRLEARLVIVMQESKQHQNNSEFNLKGAKIYEDQFKQLEQDFEHMKNELDSVKTQKNGLNEDLASHTDAINNLHEENKALRDEVARLMQQNGQYAGAATSPNQASLNPVSINQQNQASQLPISPQPNQASQIQNSSVPISPQPAVADNYSKQRAQTQPTLGAWNKVKSWVGLGKNGDSGSGGDDTGDDQNGDGVDNSAGAAVRADTHTVNPQNITPQVAKNSGISDSGGGEGRAAGGGAGNKPVTPAIYYVDSRGGQPQVIADDDDVIAKTATQLLAYTRSKNWTNVLKGSFKEMYKLFLANVSDDDLLKYKTKYKIFGNDRESIINNLNKVTFACNVMTTLGAPDYREMKQKYKELPEWDNRTVPNKNQIAEGLSKMEPAKRSELTRDIISRKLTTIPSFVEKALECDITIDKTKANGSVKNLYRQVYEFPEI